jgi:hypothetical protein
MHELRCGSCGYDLRGIETRTCPECGRAFDPEFCIDQLMPWEQHRHIGRLRAYLRTAWIVTMHPTRATEKIDRPMSVPTARRFRRIVILFLMIILATNLISAHIIWRNSQLRTRDNDILLLASTPSLTALLLGLAVGLFGACWATDAIFRSRRLARSSQLRAQAMASYAWAPLVWAPLPLLLMALTSRLIFAPLGTPPIVQTTGGIVARVWLALIALQWWIVTVLLLRISTARSWPRMILSALLLPVLWISAIVGMMLLSVAGLAMFFVIRQSLS